MHRLAAIALALLAVTVALAPSALAGGHITKDDKGRVVAVPLATPEKLRNRWPATEEDAFRDRMNHAMKYIAGRSLQGNTYNENEKGYYPCAMFYLMAGKTDAGRKALQAPDYEAGKYHQHTLGFDWYFCFTIKGQVRKYFFFGDLLDKDYRAKMKESARLWTKSDPKSTPHPKYKKYNPKVPGWGPNRFGNRQVDGRRTDNLWAMSDTSIYLMAEETGNEATRKIALERLKYYVTTMWRIGIGEWDSENYLGHTFSAYLNLYDFAKDENVRLLAKAALDWMSTAAAVKYWRGGWGGAVKRDYGNLKVLDGLAVSHFHGYFADTPQKNPRPDRDDVYMMTSAYRPPMAVVGLARNQFPRPKELFISHPTYQTWTKGGQEHPDFHETLFVGNTYQLGTLPWGNGGDVNGFKMILFNSRRGVDYFSLGDPAKIKGRKPSSRQKAFVSSSPGRVNVAQYRNLAIYLMPADKGGHPNKLMFVVPPASQPTTEQGVTFLHGEKTWLAIRPIQAEVTGLDEALGKKIDDAGDALILQAKAGAKGLAGFVLEIGEKQTHGDYDAFRKSVLAKGKLDVSGLGEGKVSYRGINGHTVGLHYSAGGVSFAKTDAKQPWVVLGANPMSAYYAAMPKVYRDGKQHDWKKHFDPYRPVDGSNVPVRQEWKSGKLYVEAGGQIFEGHLSAEGTYTFRNTAVKAANK